MKKNAPVFCNFFPLLSTKKRRTCIKNKNYKKLSQKLTKIIDTTKIVVYYKQLTKITDY